MALETGALALSIATATAAGLMGCFAVMRRMALAADALSHVALPGIGVALALRIHPLGGPGTLTAGEIVLGLVAAAGVVLFVLKKKNSLILVLVSPEVARAAGINVA